jgi:hypothetical protein
MNTDEMRAMGYRLANEFINNARMDIADELFSPNFVNHSPGEGVSSDLEGFKQYVSMLHASFSDLKSDNRGHDCRER